MKQIVALLVAAVVLGPSVLAVNVWNVIAPKTLKSIAFLTGPEGSCTAWVIDERRDLVMTAAHCDQEQNGVSVMLVDNIPAKVVAMDKKKDLMVLNVPGIDRPALKLAKENPRIGDEMGSYGYGLGLERPMFRVTHVSDDNLYVPYEGIGGPFILTDTNFIGGQSGCPVVDTAGDVVMIVQRGSEQGFGLGVGAEMIKAKMGKYFEAKDGQ